MHLDEVDLDATGERIVANLRTIKTFRAVAHELIDFMAQLEDFQKKLWLKKKFVVQCDWCMTLDLVPEELRAEVLANEKQRAAWDDLGFGDSDSLYRMVDTRFFPESFKAKLLSSIDNLDERTDGILFRSENFQALNLMQERYRGNVNCIYIDPPYNAKSSVILYKNTFKHSSWLSLIENRIELANGLCNKQTATVIAIDENEQIALGQLLHVVFPSDTTNITCITVIHNPGGIQGTNFSYTNEYAYFIYPNVRGFITDEKRNDETNPELTPFRDWGKDNSKRKESPNCFFPIFVQNNKVIGFGEIPPDDFHPVAANETHGDIIWVWPIDVQGVERRWRFSRETVERIKQELVPVSIKGTLNIQRAKMYFTRKTVWDNPKYCANVSGTQLLAQMIDGQFTFPKSLYLVEDCISACEQNNFGLVLDYFAGSGTTGHAVIDLNRQDWGKGIDAKRKYILVEMGEHFDTVLKPRIEKVVYSPDWKDGKPQSSNKGISHCFKYLTLESYEDTLNNLELKKPDGAASELLGSDEYLLRYMLDVEARCSLLSTDDFRHPFDYEMKIATDSSGAYARRKIDLVETFNWLVGLRVESEERQIVSRSCVLVEGTLPNGERALVAWRDVDKVDTAALAALLKSQGYLTDGEEKPAKEVNVLYVNGDHSLRPVISAETGETKVRSIEEEFLSLMFGEAR